MYSGSQLVAIEKLYAPVLAVLSDIRRVSLLQVQFSETHPE